MVHVLRKMCRNTFVVVCLDMLDGCDGDAEMRRRCREDDVGMKQMRGNI